MNEAEICEFIIVASSPKGDIPSLPAYTGSLLPRAAALAVCRLSWVGALGNPAQVLMKEIGR